MPLDSATLAWENQVHERELAEAIAANRELQAATAIHPNVARRVWDAARAAAQQVLAAERARDAGKRAVEAEIGRTGLNGMAAQVKYDMVVQPLEAALKRAQDMNTAAQRALGVQNTAWRELDRLQATAAAQHAAIDAECEARHAAIDRAIEAARSRCAS